jgi:hypothetical protein
MTCYDYEVARAHHSAPHNLSRIDSAAHGAKDASTRRSPQQAKGRVRSSADPRGLTAADSPHQVPGTPASGADVTRSGAPCRRTARESNLRAGASAPWCESDDFQYGLYEVDRETFVRMPKPSAGVYAAIARANAVSDS